MTTMQLAKDVVAGVLTFFFTSMTVYMMMGQ